MDEKQLKDLGARLSTARTNKDGMTQRAAAAALGLKREQTVGDWEDGKYSPSLDNLIALADLYGVSTDWILGRAQTPRVMGTGGIINLAAERAILGATSLREAEAAARELKVLLPAGILAAYKVPSEYEVLSDEEWKQRRRAFTNKLERLKDNAPKQPGTQ